MLKMDLAMAIQFAEGWDDLHDKAIVRAGQEIRYHEEGLQEVKPPGQRTMLQVPNQEAGRKRTEESSGAS